MTSPAKPSRKSSRLENQSQTPPSTRRKSERSINTTSQPPPATPPATPIVEGRKSERLGTPTTSVRKSERLLRSDTPIPVVGLGEGESSRKKKRAKKEKTIEMLQTETSEIPASEYEQHYMPLKSKRTLDARAYKAQFKTQKKKSRTEELRRSATRHEDDRINIGDNGATSSHFLGDKIDLGKIESVDNGATCSPILDDKKDLSEIESVDNGVTNSPRVGYKKDLCEIETVTCSQSSGGKKDLEEELCCRVVEDLSNDLPEGVCEGGVLESYSGLNESNALPATNSVESITSLDPVNGLAPNGSNEGNKKGLNLGASESVTPSSSSHNPDFVAICSLCSKKRRLVFDSPEEICSCTETPKGNLSDMSCQKSSNGAFAKLQTLPVGISNTSCDSLLSNVNRLHEFRLKNQNAVVVDEIERMVNMIVFIFSLSDVHKPFLVTGTSDTLVKWEAEFIRLKPSINVVVYQAARGARNSIKSIEFHREGGGKLIQVLLCPIHVISENSLILRHLKCELLIVDECQFSMNFDLLKMLDADMKILLFSGSKVDCGYLKDKEDEFLSVLSFLDPSGEFDKEDEESDSLLKLVESFSSFIAYDSTKFVEYWVPVPLSNLQLEQYCRTLHLGTSALTSYMKTDVVGDKVYDVLMTAKKCCDHPYVVDEKLVASRVQQYSSSENVDYGIKASGKLHLLSKLLSKIKSLKLRALVLYQLYDGSRESIGDMLEDLLRARFGPDQYERIEVNQTKKQAAVNRFNKEDSKQFVFLLENRACHPSIKLSADVVVIFSSELSPACDIRTLERLTFNSRRGKVPIFRLYCSCTIEEKVLILGKQLSGLNARSGHTGSTILMWGASSLFNRLEDYHAGSSKASDVDMSSEHALLDDVAQDLMDILSDTAISDSQNISIISFLRGSSIISKAFMCSSESGILYQTNPPLLGERKYQPTVEEPLIVFWRKLLEGRSPQWKFSHAPPSRNRKRSVYSKESPKTSEIPHDEVGKKRKKMDGTAVIALKPVEVDDAKEKETAGSEKDALNSPSHRKSFSRQSSVLQPDNRSLSEEQSLHDFLKADIAKLWKALKLSEDVQRLVCRILEHLMDNHKVSNDDPNVLQAFQMSLCWIAADMLGQKIDRKSSLVEARKILNFECPEDLANNVYTKLLKLKNTFPQPPDKTNDSVPLKNVPSPLGDNTLRLSSTEGPRVKVEDMPSFYPSLEQNQEPINGIAVDKKHKKLRKLKKKIEKHKLRLLQKHEEEINEFNKTWDSKREALEKEHQVELTVISHIHSQSAMKDDKLKAADTKFDNAMKGHESTKETKLKELENKHAAELEEESRNCENWLAEAEKKYGGGQSPTINDVDTHGLETSNDRQFSPTSGTTTRVLGRSPPTTITSDLSANGETELMTMQGSVPVSAEQLEAAKISSQNPKDVSAAEATSNGHVVDEIQSRDRGTGADSGLLEIHGGSLPQDGLLNGGMDLADDPLMLLNNNGDPGVQPDLCQNPVASSHECDDPAVSVDNPGLEAASLSDSQGDREQSNLHANIMDSADGGNRDEPHASEGLGNMPPEKLGLRNADDVANTAGSHNHTLSEVAGNAAEYQNGQLNGAASQNPASISRAPTIAVETQHRPILHAGPSYVELPNVQAAWNQRLRMLADPLQGEIDKMWKDREQLIKMHEDAKLHLIAEREKEITEITTQIRAKYAEKVKDAESSYLAKRIEIEANQSKVFMNKLLAEAFRSKCLDFRPSGAPVAYPGIPSVSLQQHTQLVPSSSSLRNSPVSQPASSHHQTVNPALRISTVGSSSSSPLSTSQTGIVPQQALYPPSAQSNHRPPNLSGIPFRPPPLQVGSHTPNIVSSRVGGSTDIRAPAPHLQPFRPSTSVSPSSTYTLPPPQQPVTSQVPRRTDNPPAHQPGPLRISQPASNARVSENEGVELPVPVSTNKVDDASGSKAAGDTSILSDVVCLSDDDN